MERPGVRELNKIEVPAILYEVAGAFYIFSAKCFIAKCRISKGGGIMAVDIDSLQIEIEATSSDAAAKIDALATALTNLKTAAKGGAGLTTVSKQMQALANAAKLINSSSINTVKLKEMTSALNGLSSIQKSSGLSSTINALKKLPQISESLEKADLGKFAVQMNQVADAMRPLATEMQRVSSGFSAFPIRIQKIIQSNTGLAASNSKAAKSFGVFGNGITSALAKLSIYGFTIKQVYGYAKSWVTSATDYIENVNLFQVSMGEFYDEAFAYAELLNDRLGIDPSEWMRAQGVFMSMANGFGLARQQAYDLSEGLTELAYDLSSLYNEDVSESILRLQSALSGEIEPIRRLGISISQATLQEYALAHGIDESVISMTEQEKALLRSLVLMEGAGHIGAIGDFARTLESPANAMRVLSQQITQLGRALGTVLLPIIVQIIPWIQAFVEVLTDAIRTLAIWVGFTMPEWDTNDWAGGIVSGGEDAEDAINGVTNATKELKKALLGIDELTILEPTNAGGAGGTGGNSGWGSDLEIPNIWDKDAISGIKTKADELKGILEEILYDYVLPIGAAFAAWKILGLLNNLGVATSLVSDLKKAVAGGIVAYLEFKLVKGSFDNFLSADGSIWDLIKAALYTAIGSGILYYMFGPAGLVVGLGVSLVASIISLATSISGGLDYNGLKANIMKAISTGLGGGIGFVLGGAAGGTIGLLVTAGITFTITSIMANLSGQVGSGTLENAINILLGAIVSGISGAAITMILGIAGGPVGFLIGAAISFVVQGISMNWGDITSWAKEWWSDLTAEIVGIWDDQTLSVPAKITAIGMAIVGGILSGIVDAIAGIGTWLYNNLVAPIINGVKSLLGIHSPSTVFMEIGQNIIEGLLQGISGTWSSIINFFTTEMPKWWNNNIAPWFTLEKWSGLVSSIGTSIKNVWSSTVGQWITDISAWWNNNVSPWFTLEKWTGILSGILGAFSSVWDNITSGFDKFKNVFSSGWDTFWGKVGGVVAGAINGVISAVENGINWVIKKLNSLSFTIPDWVPLLGGERFGLNIPTVKLGRVNFEMGSYAIGGFPDHGEMFIAREQGPELVGRIGNRTAVANNDQIVEGVAAGVTSANDGVINAIYAMAQQIISAIEENSGDVYLDGDKVGERVTEYQNRKNRIFGR